ncbi:MerR family transcriptional regulator [Kitasatospora viridis]|uniref:DNA-binding transcriptional MerR regulator n=1 Tax=Kitasatospora viridis TaxID=281105 RepID=A0A561UBQ1_9ACTN|nr:MerR family transcriptional regulator [Kitasatospora viridis]TWF96791.1 DNA-binding transcriptional MerR regulator [Kitasatospora viridis]
MNGDASYSIGDLARHAGVTVKAVRFYSDRGLLPPAERSPAGHRRYRHEALARIELIRTLRELGLDLRTVRQVLDRELPLHRVAATHAAALEVQIRTLRLRQALLTAAAERTATLEEMETMHRLARLSERERRELIEDFLAAVLPDGPQFRGVATSLTPELPEQCTEVQLRAWVELAELAQQPDFRAVLRGLAERQAARQAAGAVPVPDPVARVLRRVRPALAAGLAPEAPGAAPVAATVAAELRAAGVDPAELAQAHDPRLARYLDLLAVVNGWPAPEDPGPALAWATTALRAHGA